MRQNALGLRRARARSSTPPLYFVIGGLLSCLVLYGWFAHRSPIDTSTLVTTEKAARSSHLLRRHDNGDMKSSSNNAARAALMGAVPSIGGGGDDGGKQDKVHDSLLGKFVLKAGQEAPELKGDDPRRFVRHEDLPAGTRVLPPGSMMTMDYRPERLNVHTDEHGKVLRVNFG